VAQAPVNPRQPWELYISTPAGATIYRQYYELLKKEIRFLDRAIHSSQIVAF
jgi:hypothetical protein